MDEPAAVTQETPSAGPSGSGPDRNGAASPDATAQEEDSASPAPPPPPPEPPQEPGRSDDLTRY